jgi:hypothetical protein
MLSSRRFHTVRRLSVRGLAVFTAVVLGVSLSTAGTGQAAPVGHAPPLAPIDPQHWQDQQDMTWNDYKPIPGVSWATNGAVPTDRALRVALVAIDFPDQPFVITKPKNSDPFGNPQIDPVTRDQVPRPSSSRSATSSRSRESARPARRPSRRSRTTPTSRSAGR